MPSSSARSRDISKRGRSAIGKLRRVAGRHRSLAAVRIEVGLKRQQPFERRIGAVALVAVAAVTSSVPIFSPVFLSSTAIMALHGRDLVVEKTFALRARRALLADQRIFILRLPADAGSAWPPLRQYHPLPCISPVSAPESSVRINVALRPC